MSSTEVMIGNGTVMEYTENLGQGSDVKDSNFWSAKRTFPSYVTFNPKRRILTNSYLERWHKSSWKHEEPGKWKTIDFKDNCMCCREEIEPRIVALGEQNFRLTD